MKTADEFQRLISACPYCDIPLDAAMVRDGLMITTVGICDNEKCPVSSVRIIWVSE